MPGKKGLLLVGDVSTSTLSDADKSVAPLFSDAGSATALEWKNGEMMHFNLQSDGAGYDAIIIPEGGMEKPFSQKSLDKKEIEPGIKRSGLDVILNGVRVFNFSLREVAPNVNQLLETARIEKKAVDYFVFHQANKLMNESIRRKLKLPPEKVPYSLHDFGNTSCATVPLSLIHI